MMDDAMAESLWNIVINDYAPKTWDDIPEEEPDGIDLMMLKEIGNDPDCHEFISEKDIDWND